LGERVVAADALSGLSQLSNQGVDFGDEGFAVGMGMLVEQIHGVLRQRRLSCHPCPAPNLTVGEQGKPTQIVTSTGKLQIAKKIFKSGLQGWIGCRHVAVQHCTFD
jgi:hypothetical protein